MRPVKEKVPVSSRHLVDPELIPIIDNIPDMSVSAEKLAAARAVIVELTRQQLADADTSVRVTEHVAQGREGAPQVRVLLYRPPDLEANAPVLLQIHGGGFLFGTAELGDPRNRALAKAIGCAIVSTDYRLAPESIYPAALEDVYAALTWVHERGPALGLDPRRIAVRGDSAGGGLAAALAMLARDRSGPPILFQLLVYPMLDDRTCVAGHNPFAGEFIWDSKSNLFAWRSWLGMDPGGPGVPVLAAPARSEILGGLPPTMIATAALDLFIDENLEFARRLLQAGVPTEVYVAPGAFHGFEAIAPNATISRIFIERCIDAVKRAFKAPLPR
jgi:acetyl esterase/lipase